MANAFNAVALCLLLAYGPLLKGSTPEIVWQFDTGG